MSVDKVFRELNEIRSDSNLSGKRESFSVSNKKEFYKIAGKLGIDCLEEDDDIIQVVYPSEEDIRTKFLSSINNIAKLDEELLVESKVGNKEIEDDFYDTVCDKLGVDNLPGNAYIYKGHIITDVDGSWSVDGEGKFSTDKDAEKEVDNLNEDEVTNEKSSKDLPQVDHVYWDKKHENAYYVVAVYPKDNKVSFWNMDNDRKQLTIDEFMKRYELSTNEDDYDLFEEARDKDFFTALNEAADKWEIGESLYDYLVSGLKDKVFHWKDNGEEADETDLLDYSGNGLKIKADEIKESDELIKELEDLVDKWKDSDKYNVYVDWKKNVVDFKEDSED